jgi:hypothetical protein
MKYRVRERTKHECTSYRAGDWIIYRCKECAYEFRENWRTGEAKVRNSSRQAGIDHFGGYTPIEYKGLFESLN